MKLLVYLSDNSVTFKCFTQMIVCAYIMDYNFPRRANSLFIRFFLDNLFADEYKYLTGTIKCSLYIAN